MTHSSDTDEHVQAINRQHARGLMTDTERDLELGLTTVEAVRASGKPVKAVRRPLMGARTVRPVRDLDWSDVVADGERSALMEYDEDVAIDADDAVAVTDIFPPLKPGEMSAREARRSFDAQYGDMAKVNSLWVISGLVNGYKI